MKVFISYSHADKQYLERLHTHLAQLRRDGLIQEWFDRELLAGDELDPTIMQNLEDSRIFLPLVSPDFIASEYCYGREMLLAEKLQQDGRMRIVSVIVEPCDWKHTPLAKYVVLPEDGREVSSFQNANTAFLQVAGALRRIASSPVERTITSTPDASSMAQQITDSATRRVARSKRVFDRLDLANFRDQAFVLIVEYFDRALNELNSVEGIVTKLDRFEPAAITATIANRNIGKVVSITVRSGGGESHMADIYYIFGERAPSNTANGTFRIASDEFDLFFDGGPFSLRRGWPRKGLPPAT